MSSLINGLDKRQKEAVLHDEGPLLVLAGAGSGKTRVLTSRIARLVTEKKCKASEILAVTFTNKAAREMQERIAKLTSKDAASLMTVSTFHSFGVKVLREHGPLVGLSKKFTILDDNDRTSTLKTILRNGGRSLAKEDHSEFANIISLAKNGSMEPETFERSNPEDRKASRVYKEYYLALKKRQAVDFDDLLLLPLKIFKEYPRVLKEYRKRYKFISIDEFQDTNTVQMQMAKLLAAPKNNLMVVGDDDQGIYSWRGAEISNILNFSRSFKGAKTVILNRNYRSTEEIVNGAYGVIEKNPERKSKSVKAASGPGHPIITLKADDEEDESRRVVDTIVQNNKDEIFKYKEHAILFRTNAMMRRFEEELRTQRVPYFVQGAMSFFDRKEVKDIFSYMRFFANTADEMSLTRVLKVPNRGITPTSIELLEELAGMRKMTLWEAFERYEDVPKLQPNQKEKIQEFLDFFKKHNKNFEEGRLSLGLRGILADIEYVEKVKKAYKSDKSLETRLEIIEEVIHGLELWEEKKKGKGKLHTYLHQTSLTTNDNPDENKNRNGVILMTIHKSKGLEFPVVFLPALDDTVLPSPRSIAEGNIAEERRLFYVGMTRAEKRLILSFPATKLVRKITVDVTPTRFLREIPEEYLDAKIGEKEDKEHEEYTDNFFASMQNMLGS